MPERPSVGASPEEEGRTDPLLVELRRSKSDLARLVEVVVRERRQCVAVSVQAVHAWESREPQAWAAVRTWLADRGVRVVTTSSSASS
jgi:hypothetical protein